MPPSSPINLIIRFPTHPDLHLPTLSTPHLSTPLFLKQLIRTNLPPTLSASRLRLIHAGHTLPDTVSLATCLRLPPAPLVSAKGKTPIYPTQTIYVHCSISDDVLSSSELADEEALARSSLLALKKEDGGRGPSGARGSDQEASRDGLGESKVGAGAGAGIGVDAIVTTTTPAPQGFDRLLSTGFMVSEIAALRSQFLAIQAHTHTPDTMPSAAELRVLEDRWIDNTHAAGVGGEAGFGGGGDEEEGVLDDMLWGNLVGFFWPVGALGWGVREEGVWTRRRRVAVATGVLVNVLFSVLRFAG